MKHAEICGLLDIKESTLRKYASEFERVGYTFKKNNKGHRVYSDEDLLKFRQLIKIKESTTKAFGDAIREILNIKEEQNTLSNTITYYEQREERLKAMYEIDLKAAHKKIAFLEEELERLHIYKSRREQAAAIEQPSSMKKGYSTSFYCYIDCFLTLLLKHDR